MKESWNSRTFLDQQSSALEDVLEKRRSVQIVYEHTENNVERLVCPQCFKTYATKGTLKRHLIYECGKLPQFSCPFCNLKSYHKSNMERHIRRQHQK